MATIQKPTLTNGSTTIELPYPTSCSSELMVKKADNISLGGIESSDIMYRKYKYTFNYETIWSDDYNALASMIDGQYTNFDTLYFNYAKFPTASSVAVIATLGEREAVAGSGTDYYSSLKVEFMEIEAR